MGSARAPKATGWEMPARGRLYSADCTAARSRHRQRLHRVFALLGQLLVALGGDARALESERARSADCFARDTARDDLFAKGQSRRIWAELYKVLDCSDVVVHVVDARDVPPWLCLADARCLGDCFL